MKILRIGPCSRDTFATYIPQIPFVCAPSVETTSSRVDEFMRESEAISALQWPDSQGCSWSAEIDHGAHSRVTMRMECGWKDSITGHSAVRCFVGKAHWLSAAADCILEQLHTEVVEHPPKLPHKYVAAAYLLGSADDALDKAKRDIEYHGALHEKAAQALASAERRVAFARRLMRKAMRCAGDAL